MNPELPLRDIHLPPEPSWWPPAPGWWLLALAATLLLIWLARRLWHWRLRVRRLRALRQEFAAVAALEDHSARLRGLSTLLRRAAVLQNANAAGLRGEEWLAYLDRQIGSSAFSTGPGRVLLDGPYQSRVESDAVAALLEPARRCFDAMVQAR